MAPQPQGLTLEQKQAIARARAKAAAQKAGVIPAQPSNGAGMGPVNPMVEMGLNAQRQALIGEAERYRQGKIDQVQAQRRPFVEEPVDVQQVIADMDKSAADRARREAYEQEGIRQNKESLFGSLGIPTGFDPKKYANTRMAGDAVVEDVSKLGKTAPLNVWNGGVQAVQSTINLLPDVAQALLDVGGETKTQNRVPTADLQRARMEIAPEDQSVSGGLLEGLVQFIAARKAVGKAAPGGGIAPQIGKDALAVGVGFDGSTGRVADMIDPSIIPEGPLRDYAQFLRTQPEDSPLVGRFKNMLEDMTFSGPAVVPQAVVAPAMRGAANLVNPPAIPTNAGGARLGPINTAAVPPATAVPPTRPAPAPQPSVAPIPQPTVSNAPRRGAQPAAPGAGQGAGPPTLQATPVPGNPAVAKDTQDILRKLLIDSNVPRNDVDRLLVELTNDFQVFKGSGSPVASRVGLGEFVDSNVRQTANRIGVPMTPDVERQIQNALRGRGRAAHGSEGGSKQDRQPSVMSQYIEDLRTTQKDWAREQIEAPNAFNKADISVQKQAMEATADDIGQQVYGEGLKLAKDVWSKAAPAAPGEIEALTKLQTYLNRKPYLDNIPASMKLRLAIDDIPLETRIAQDPAGTAHWIQSKLGKAASEAADPDMRSALGEARERLLRELEAAVPAYKQARADYGDEFATMRAFDFGRPFFADTRRPLDVAEMKADYSKMTTRQKTAARMAVRDEIFGVFGMNAEDAAVRLEVLTRENTLNALEEVFGAPGKRVADTLRRLRQESNWMAGDKSRGLPGVDIYSGSNTVANAQILNRDAASVRNGFQRAIAKAGDVSKFMFAVPADLALMVGSGGAYHLPMLSLGAAGGKITKGLANANPRKLSNATEGLFSLSQQAPTSAPRRVTSRARGPSAAQAPLPTDRRALLEAYAAAPTKRERERIRRALEAMGENTPALVPPSRPPTDAGFAGVGPLSAMVGGAGGYLGAQDINGDGTIDAGERAAFTVGGAAGGYAASRMLPKPKTGGAPTKPPPAMAEAPKAPPAGPAASVSALPESMRLASARLKDGSTQDVVADVFTDRGVVVVSPSWPTNAGNDLADALVSRSNELRGPRKGFKVVDENYAPNTPREPSPKWSSQNPQEMADLTKQVADRFIGLSRNGDAHVLALTDEVDLNSLASYLEANIPSSKQLVATRDGGEIAIVSKRWLRDNADQFAAPTWEPLYPSYNQGKGLRPAPADWAAQKAPPASPPVKPSGAPKPPPVQETGNKLKAPPKPKGEGPGIVSRMVTGGATGLAVSLANDARAQQEDLAPKIARTEQDIAAIKRAMADFDKITDPFEKQRFLKSAGFYAGKIDGNIAGKTTEGMERWKAKQEAAMAAAEADMVELVRRDAYQKNHPDPYMVALRDYGPTVAGFAALFGLKYLRGSAAKKSIMVAEAEAKNINRLITKGPVKSFVNKADQSRPENLNTFWKKGGASIEELPFKQDSTGKWKPNPKAKPAHELFQDNGYWRAITKYVDGKDLGLILGGTLDAVGVQPFIDNANKNLREAEEEWKSNPSAETFKRIEDAKNEIAAYTLVQRLGQGLVAGRILGAFGKGKAYARPAPNVQAAATEQAGIKAYIASKKPPSRPRTPKGPPQLPPTPGGGGNGSGSQP